MLWMFAALAAPMDPTHPPKTVPGAGGAPPLIDLDPPVNFALHVADMLGACHAGYHVSVEADLSNWSHHYMTETPYTDVHIRWRNVGAPTTTWVSPLERHRAHVAAAVEAVNAHMASLPGLRASQSWRPLVVDYHDNHSVIRHSGQEGFLQECRIQNRSRSPLEITLDKVIEPCVARNMNGRELIWTEERFSAITVIVPPRTDLSLLDAIESRGDRLVWHYGCMDISRSGILEGDSCFLTLSSEGVQDHRGTLDLLKSYQLLGGTTGCDGMP